MSSRDEPVGFDSLPPDVLECVHSTLARSDLRRALAVCNSCRAAARATLASARWRRRHACLRVMRLPHAEQAYTNRVYLHPDDIACEPGERLHLRVGGFAFLAAACDEVPSGRIALSQAQRRSTRLVDGAATKPSALHRASSALTAVAGVVALEASLVLPKAPKMAHRVDRRELKDAVRAAFDGHVLQAGLRLAVQLPDACHRETVLTMGLRVGKWDEGALGATGLKVGKWDEGALVGATTLTRVEMAEDEVGWGWTGASPADFAEAAEGLRLVEPSR